MKFCTDHWAALRNAIDERGLAALVAESGEQAVRNLVGEIAEGRTIDNFDPLMAAHNAIMANSMRVVPTPLLMEMMAGEHCPLCWLNANDPSAAAGRWTYDVWIASAADDALAAWKAMR